jgi:hypothetical protein
MDVGNEKVIYGAFSGGYGKQQVEGVSRFEVREMKPPKTTVESFTPPSEVKSDTGTFQLLEVKKPTQKIKVDKDLLVAQEKAVTGSTGDLVSKVREASISQYKPEEVNVFTTKVKFGSALVSKQKVSQKELLKQSQSFGTITEIKPVTLTGKEIKTGMDLTFNEINLTSQVQKPSQMQQQLQEQQTQIQTTTITTPVNVPVIVPREAPIPYPPPTQFGFGMQTFKQSGLKKSKKRSTKYTEKKYPFEQPWKFAKTKVIGSLGKTSIKTQKFKIPKFKFNSLKKGKKTVFG